MHFHGMPAPYYSDNHITIYHGDNRELLPLLAAALPSSDCPLLDAVLTDPPYDMATHKGARTTAHKGELVDFESITYADLADRLGEIASMEPAWVVMTCADSHCARFEGEKWPGRLRFVRRGVWDKLHTGAPQKTGDRPAQGWEAVAHFWGDGQKRARRCWSGGGRDSVYRHPIERSKVNPTAKPYSLVSEWVSLFSTPGGLILDPWCGRGTVARAAKDRGRRCIAIDVREEQCEAAAEWASQAVLPGMAAA